MRGYFLLILWFAALVWLGVLVFVPDRTTLRDPPSSSSAVLLFSTPSGVTTTICSYLNVSYPCASIFDAAWYRANFNIPQSLPDDVLLQNASTTWLAQGRSLHGGDKVFKLVVMTKDEWPLIRAWVLYHAHFFGGENLYVLDGSTQKEPIAFLKLAAENLGVVVFFTKSNLNQIIYDINTIMTSLRFSADFISKFDSDEFLVRLHHNSDTKRTFSTVDIHDAVNRLPVDGSRYKFSYYSHSVPITNCTFGDGAFFFLRAAHRLLYSSPPPLLPSRAHPHPHPRRKPDPTLTTYFEVPWKTGLKTFFSAPAFDSTDLGNHHGRVRSPFSMEHFIETDLAIAHYHYGCFDVMMFNTRKALVGCGYFQDEDSPSVVMEKLAALDQNKVNSGHKVGIYLDYLKDPFAYKKKREMRSTANVIPEYVFDGIRNITVRLTCGSGGCW